MKNQKYSQHFLLNTNTVIDYVKDCTDYFDDQAELTASEIGDGNINYVFRVKDQRSGKSLVVKQADKLLRSSGRPLDLHRSRIEAEILRTEGKLAPGFTPIVYDYNETMCALTMEDISTYKNLRTEMLKGKTFPLFADNITAFIADTLLPTTDLVLDRHEKKRKVQLFTNIDCCDITEDLVFTEPYYNYKNRNIITEGEEAFVAENLYQNEYLKGQVGLLRDRFMNEAQAMIHGDLHSGSIFINENGIKVIDPEFSFYGPIGYDVGNVIGNLFLAWANKLTTASDQKEFLNWIENTIRDIYDQMKEQFGLKYDSLVTCPLYNAHFKKTYIDEIMADAMGYAGTEMIRRTVGDTKTLEITSVADHSKRVLLDKLLILSGMRFIERRNQYMQGSDITDEFERTVSELWN